MSSDVDAQEPEAEDTHDEVAEVTAKGRPGLFVLLTCGFLACMCCVGVTFVGGTLGWTRMAKLDAALDEVGTPEGWKTDDSSATPWSAEASLSGPADAQVVSNWLDGLDDAASPDEVARCLAAEPCAAEFTVDGFGVSVEYGSDGDNADKAWASVLVDQ